MIIVTYLSYPVRISKCMNQEIFLQNKYTKWYYAIVNNPISKHKEVGLHRHHIIPESFFINRTRKGPSGWIEGDSEHINNIAYLSPRAHLICHKLLVRMTQGKAKAKMYHGLQVILAKSDNHSMTGRQYELLQDGLSRSVTDQWTPERRLIKSQMNTGSGNPFFGKNHSIEQKQKWSNRLNGKTYEELYGAEKARIMRNEKSITNTGANNPFYDKQHSEKTKQKMSISASKPKTQAWKDSASTNRKGRIPHNKNKTYEELYGEEKANELKKKVSNSGDKNGFYGKQHSEEQRKRKSAEKLGASKIKCYHCSKEVDHMNYSRWHGDNCKHKGESKL